MSLTSWMKSWGSEQVPVKKQPVLMAESLLMELKYQIAESEEQRREKERLARQAKGGVDYKWLTTPVDKPYEIPPLNCLELEELFMKVKPEECGRVISMFRDLLLREPPVQEYAGLMRMVVHQVLEARPKEETIPEWISKSLTSLSKIPKLSRKITPISVPGDDVEMQKSNITNVFSISSVSLAESQTSIKTNGNMDNFNV